MSFGITLVAFRAFSQPEITATPVTADYLMLVITISHNSIDLVMWGRILLYLSDWTNWLITLKFVAFIFLFWPQALIEGFSRDLRNVYAICKM